MRCGRALLGVLAGVVVLAVGCPATVGQAGSIVEAPEESCDTADGLPE
jgi:hypothetical protein